MRYLPIQLDVRGRRVLVVGACGEMVSKIDRLLRAEAHVVVVTEGDVDTEVDAHAREGRLSLARRPFERADLEGAVAAYVEPRDDGLLEQLHAWALAEGRLLCTVDRPATCTFIQPALVATPELTITVSTSGASPGTAKRIREDLEVLFADPRFARYIEALRGLRERTSGPGRMARMRAAISGFGLEGRLRFPAWLERGETP